MAPAVCHASIVERFRADETGAGQAAVGLARKALDAYCLRRERISVPADLPAAARRARGSICQRPGLRRAALLHGDTASPGAQSRR